jgi:hypothetical protein
MMSRICVFQEKRPDFQRLIELIEQNEIDVILATEVERLVRQPGDKLKQLLDQRPRSNSELAVWSMTMHVVSWTVRNWSELSRALQPSYRASTVKSSFWKPVHAERRLSLQRNRSGALGKPTRASNGEVR